MSFGSRWGKAAAGDAVGILGGAAAGAAIGSVIPVIGTGIGALLGGLLGGTAGTTGGIVAGGMEEDPSSKKRKWGDLGFFEKASLQIDKGVSNFGHMITGDDSLTDSEKLENILKKNNEGASADAITSLQTGGQIYGEDTEGKQPQGQQAQPQQGLAARVLGRPNAVSEGGSLDDVNFNNNNFSF